MIVKRIKTGRDRRDGAVLVELALVIPVFFVCFFGLVDIGRGFMVKSLLENAARVGCRTGILQAKSNSDVQAAVTAALNGQGITGTTTTILVNGSATVSGTAVDVYTAKTGDLITVSVSVPIANITWLPGTHYLTGTIVGSFSLPHG